MIAFSFCNALCLRSYSFTEFRFNSVALPPVLTRLKLRSATDAENFLAALSSDIVSTTSSVTAATANQVNQRGVSNLLAWMSQEVSSGASDQTNCATVLSSSPQPSSGIKVPPPKRLDADAANNSPARAQTTAACAVGADRSSERMGERGVSNLPAWMTQDAASAAAVSEDSNCVAVSSAMGAAAIVRLNEIKIPVPKTAAEAAVAFPLLSQAAAASGKRDRVDEVSDGSAKRARASSAADMFHEVAMLLQDAEVEGTGEQQQLEDFISKAVRADDGLRRVSLL